MEVFHIGTIRIDDSICETAKAARHLKSKAATLRFVSPPSVFQDTGLALRLRREAP
jgi:hypothetical protein